MQATEDLARKKVRDPGDFEWLKQARFYWREDRDTALTSICDVDFEYSYEYLGEFKKEGRVEEKRRVGGALASIGSEQAAAAAAARSSSSMQ